MQPTKRSHSTSELVTTGHVNDAEPHIYLRLPPSTARTFKGVVKRLLGLTPKMRMHYVTAVIDTSHHIQANTTSGKSKSKDNVLLMPSYYGATSTRRKTE